jgi:hypothetical protein
MRIRSAYLSLLSVILLTARVEAQATGAEVRAIERATHPIPAEAATADSSRFSFIVYGDTRGRRDGIDVQYEHSLIVDDMMRTIARLRNSPFAVRFVLQTGDAVVNGRDAAQWNTSFVGLINRLTKDAGVPYFLAPGNHDVTASADLESPQRQAGLQNYLRAMGALIPPDGATRRLNGYPTYAFGYGNTFVIGLDSNIAEDTIQQKWALAQLEALDRRRYIHVIAFFHHPVFSSGPHGGPTLERSTAALRDTWMPHFRRLGVTLILTGHEHLFEHWTERYRDGERKERRIDQLVTGGGGAPLYAYRGEPNLTAYLAAGRADSVRVQHVVRPGPLPGDNPYHYVVVRVDGGDVSLEIFGIDWGAGFSPYRSNAARLGGGSER